MNKFKKGGQCTTLDSFKPPFHAEMTMTLTLKPTVSEQLRSILMHGVDGRKPFNSNDSIYTAIERLALNRGALDTENFGEPTPFDTDAIVDELIEEVTEKMEAVLQALVIDTQNDPNAKDTAWRYAKMLILETFKGRYEAPPELRDFPNTGNLDEIYTVGPITLRSTCAHHHVPISGEAWVGVMPRNKLLGLSKFHRIVDHIASRPQIQEGMTVQIADMLESLIDPIGLAVLVRANHLCCGHRGVKDADSRMVTSVVRGEFRTNPSLKTEFFNTVALTKE